VENELDLFRKLWTWIAEDYKYYLAHINYPCRIRTRDAHEYVGVLGTTHWDLTAIELEVREPIYDYLAGTKTWEVKTIRVPINTLVGFELIHDKEIEYMQQDAGKEALEPEGEPELV